MVGVLGALGLACALQTAHAQPSSDAIYLATYIYATGHTTNDAGEQFPTATVIVCDPGNSNPLMQQSGYIVSVQAGIGKTQVGLSAVGTWVSAYVWEFAEGSKALMVAYTYTDKKGRKSVRGEPHLITGEVYVRPPE